VMDRPDTQFAWNGDVALAYQDSPVDLMEACGHVHLLIDGPS